MVMNLSRSETSEVFGTSEAETNYAYNILVVAANAGIRKLLRYVQHGEDARKPEECVCGVNCEFRHRLAKARASSKKGDIQSMHTALRALRDIMPADFDWSADMRNLAKVKVNLAAPPVALAGRATSGQLLDMLGGYESAADRASAASYAARIIAERKNQDIQMLQALAEAYPAQAALERAVARLYPADAVEAEFALGDLLDESVRERLRNARADDSAVASVPAKPQAKGQDIAPKPKADVEARPATKSKSKPTPTPAANLEAKPPLKPKPKPVAMLTAQAKPPAKLLVPKSAKPAALRRRRRKPRRIAVGVPAITHECRAAPGCGVSFSLPCS